MTKQSTPIKKIIFTGGGTAGHVTPNFPLIKKFQQAGWVVEYIGSKNGIEKELIGKINIPYHAITTSKLRRYFSWQNFLAPFMVLLGIMQAIWLCYKSKANIVFSKGGFVALPVVIGAWLNRIPVIAHESDLTPGLTTKLSMPFVKKICVTFPEGANHFKNKSKTLVTGTPIRQEFLSGDKERGKRFCGFQSDKPCVLIIGGSLGAARINQIVRDCLPKLLINFQIIHICGKGKTLPELNATKGYVQFEYLHDELYDVMAYADFIISRAGANSIYELLVLQKPHILIPLTTAASRGDQLANANYFAQKGLSILLKEETLTCETLLARLQDLQNNQSLIKQKLANLAIPDSNELIYKVLIDASLT